jgi:hypothetical protein
VQGGPHEGPANHQALFDRLAQVLAAEVGDSRPQADEGRLGLLGLQAGQPLQRGDDRDVVAGQQQLPGQGGPVELPAGQRLDVGLRGAAGASSLSQVD